MGSMMNKSRV